RVGDRMRSYRSVAEPAKLDLELLADDGTQPLGGRTRPGRIIVDMRVIAPIRDGVGGVGHGHAPCRPRYASEGRGTLVPGLVVNLRLGTKSESTRSTPPRTTAT